MIPQETKENIVKLIKALNELTNKGATRITDEKEIAKILEQATIEKAEVGNNYMLIAGEKNNNNFMLMKIGEHILFYKNMQN